LLTGDKNFLQGTDTLKRTIQESLTKLASGADHSVIFKKQLKELDSLIQRRLDVSDELLNAKANGELEPSYLSLVFRRSMLLEKRIQLICDELWNAETERLNITEIHNGKGVTNLNIILYLSLAAFLFIGFALYRKAWRKYDQHKSEKKRFSTLLDAAPDAMILVNREGFIRFCKAESVQMFGYTDAEIKGMKVEELIPEGLRNKHSKMRHEFQSSEKTRSFHTGLELQLLKKDGQIIPVEISLSPVRLNEKTYMLASIRDLSARKAAEEEIRTLYQQINQAHEAIAILNTDFSIRTWNGGAEALFGYSASEAIGKNAKDHLLTQENEAEPYKLMHSNRDHIYWAGKLTIKAKNETVKTVHTSLTAIRNLQGELTGYVAVCYDISESTRLQQELEYLAGIVEQSGIAILSTDLNQRILSWNKGAEKLHGYTAEEAIGHTPDELRLGSFSESEIKTSNSEMMSKGNWELEGNLYRKDGSSFFGQLSGSLVRDDKGKPNSVMIVARDLSKRKEMEDQLKMYNTELEKMVEMRTNEVRKSENKYRSLFENNPMPMLLYENDTRHFRDVNQAAIDLYGFTRDEFMFMKMTDLLPDIEDKKGSTVDYGNLQQLSSGKKTWLHARKDGSIAQVQIFKHPVTYEGHAAQLVLVKDLTEKIQVQDSLKAEQDKLKWIVASTPGVLYSTRYNEDKSSQILYMSETAEDILGVKPEDAIRDFSIISDRIFKEDLKLMVNEADRSAKELSQWKVQFRYHHPVKGLIWIEGSSLVSPGPDRSVLANGIMMDITASKNAAEKIDLQRAQLTTISDNLPGLLIYQMAGYSFEDRHFTYFSKEIINITGHTPEEVLKEPYLLYQLIHPEDVPVLIMAEKKAFDTKSRFEAEIRLILPSGETRHYHMNSIPRVRMDGLTVWDGFQIDITARIKSQETIRASVERFEMVSRATRDVIWDWDIRAGIVWRNDNFFIQYGYRKPATNGNGNGIAVANGNGNGEHHAGWWKHVHQDDRQKIYKGIRNCINHRRPFWKDEYRYLRADGSQAYVNDCGYIIYDDNGQPVRMVGAMEDISEIKRTSNELNKSFEENKLLMERLSSIINTLPARVALLDNWGRVVEVNNAWRNFECLSCGTPSYLSIGEDYLQLVKESGSRKEDGLNMQNGIQSVLNKSVPEFQYEYVCGSKTGRSWYKIIVTPIENEKYSGAVVMHLDITTLRKLEMERLKAKTLEQRNITAAMLQGQEKERTAIAKELHDNVNQILTGTKIMLSLANTNPEKSGEVVPVCIENIELAIAENRKIAHELVTPNLKKNDLLQQIERLTRSMLQMAGYETTIHSENYLPDALSRDKQLAVYRILQEQCTNIVKYAKGDSVDITLESLPDFFRLVIKDNGAGMLPDQVNEGIGLKNIDSRIGVFDGKMKIITAPGEGFQLTVLIPAD
jgi:PAS domain S-box-containing protein